MATIEARVAASLTADRVFYQDLKDLELSVSEEADEAGVRLHSFDSSCFNGKYVTSAAVGEAYLDALAQSRTADRGSGTSAIHLLDKLDIPAKKPRRA